MTTNYLEKNPNWQKWREKEQAWGKDAIKYERSPFQVVDDVEEIINQAGFDTTDPPTMWIFLREYKKTAKDSHPVNRAWEAAKRMQDMREEWKKENPNQVDTKWPPDGPPRHGDPRQELRELVIKQAERIL